MNYSYLVEHKELFFAALLVGAFLPFVLRKICCFLFSPTGSVYSSAYWFLDQAWKTVVNLFGNPYATGLLTGFLFAFQIFWLQQWIFAYNQIHEAGNVYNQYAYFPLTVAIPMFFVNIFMMVASLVRTCQNCPD